MNSFNPPAVASGSATSPASPRASTILVSDQPLSDFLAEPKQPDMASYRVFRNYLLQTSQLPGGFYSRRSRAHALRLAADLILAPEDPYQALAAGRFQRRQQIGELLD